MKYTYFYFNPLTGLTKIGRTLYPLRRFSQLCVGHKSELIRKCILEGDFELKTHRQYAKYRQHGEWFYFPDAVLDKICNQENNIVSEFVDAPKIESVPAPVFYENPELFDEFVDLESPELITIVCQTCNGCGEIPLGQYHAEVLSVLLDADRPLMAFEIPRSGISLTAMNNRLVFLEENGLAKRVGKQGKNVLWTATPSK